MVLGMLYDMCAIVPMALYVRIMKEVYAIVICCLSRDSMYWRCH